MKTGRLFSIRTVLMMPIMLVSVSVVAQVVFPRAVCYNACAKTGVTIT